MYPWQKTQWQKLVTDYRQNRLAHALLLNGTSGLGKFSFAEQFAQFLLCTQSQAEQACGHCSGCRLVLAKNHPDLLIVTPEDSKIIKIEQVRQLIYTLAHTSHRAGYQVVIMYPAEALNKAAANALLKTLEEPMGAVVFLLVSHQPGALPATILSRCQKIVFSCQDQQQAQDWVSNELKNLAIEANPKLLLKMAEYSPLRALSLAQNQYIELRDQLLAHLLAVCQKKSNPIGAVPQFLKLDLQYWVNAFVSLLDDLLRLKLGVRSELLTNQDRVQSLSEMNQVFSLSALLALQSQLQQSRQWLLSNSIHLNTQLLLENILIQWQDDGVGAYGKP